MAVAALLLPLLASCSKDEGKALPAPKTSETTTTTEPVDLTQVPVAPIAVVGRPTSTTFPPGGGKASVAGRVLDPGGAPVGGAFVRAAFFGDPSAPEVIEAIALEDGTYRFDQLRGGRWRVRAWRAPELATLEAPEFFLGYTENRVVDLKVKGASDVAVTSSMAPSPPFTGSPVELAVLVMNQTIDDEGLVHRSPAAGAAVTLDVFGRWSLAGEATQGTDGTGRAAWTLTCNNEGAAGITAVVGGRDFPLNIPACLDPASTSTTTLPPGASSTTSSTKPKSSSSTSPTRPKSYATTSTKPGPKGR